MYLLVFFKKKRKYKKQEMSIRTEMEKMKKDSDDAMKRLAHIESENEKIVRGKQKFFFVFMF